MPYRAFGVSKHDRKGINGGGGEGGGADGDGGSGDGGGGRKGGRSSNVTRSVERKQRRIRQAEDTRDVEAEQEEGNAEDVLFAYLRYGLWLDVAAAVALWVVAAFAVPDWVLVLVAVPRLRRIMRLQAFFRAQEMNLSVDVRRMALAKFVLLIFGTVHWVGCVFFMLCRVCNNV